MKILSNVWMLVSKNGAVIYEIGTSAKEVWDKVIENETMGTFCSKEDLKAKGFRAKKVQIVIP